MTTIKYRPKDYNWRGISCNRYLPTPDDNCILNNESYINCPNVCNHSSSLYYHNGILYLTWFSGDNEGDDGCNIYISRLADGSRIWSDAELIITQSSYACHNSLMYHDGTKFVLFYSSQNHKLGDSDAHIYMITSEDTHIWENNLLFDSTYGVLIRNRMFKLSDATLIIPYYNCNNDYVYTSGYYISHDNGNKWDKQIIKNTENLIELVMINPYSNHLKCYYRDKKAQYIYMNQSYDDGNTWTDPMPIKLDNNDSAFDIIDYKHNNINYYIMCCNRKHDLRNNGRSLLSLYATNDILNDNWQLVKDLDPHMEMPHYVWQYGEFSYPAMHIIEDKLHITYTYNKKTIKHVIVNINEIISV